MKCAWPGCENEKQNARNSLWCRQHRDEMDESREKRRIGKAARQAVRPHEFRVGGNGKKMPSDIPHVPTVHCKVCCGLPWARMPGRANNDLGGWGEQSVTTPGCPYTCRGCGEPYAPEPRLELCGTIRSSAGSAVEHGELYGTNPSVRATGSRRK